MTSTLRAIRYGFSSGRRQLFRYWGRSCMTFLTLSLLFSLVSVAAWFGLNSASVVKGLGDALHVSIYFSANASMDTKQALQHSMCTQVWVKACEPRTVEQAKRLFLINYPNLGQTLDTLQANPFPASLEIDIFPAKITEEALTQTLANMRKSVGVESIETSAAWLQKWNKIQAYVQKFLGSSGLCLLFLSIMILINTVALLVLFHQDEIEVLDLMGANLWSKMTPFLLQSMLFVLLAMLVSTLVAYGFFQWMQNHFALWVQEWFGGHFVFFSWRQVFGAFFLGLVLSLLSSWCSCVIILKRLRS